MNLQFFALVGSRLYILLVFVFLVMQGKGQDSIATRSSSFIPIPIAYWTPETRVAIGAALSYNFHPVTSDTISPPSQVQASFTVTQNRQWYAYAPFQVFLKERKWYTYGQLGFYDFNYQFFGVNSEVESIEERYDVDINRFRLNVLRQVQGRWYTGARVWAENWRPHEFTLGGEFASGKVPGGLGGTTIDLGWIVFLDERDNVFYPKQGKWLELVTQHSLGDYGYSRYRLDGRVYLPFGEDIVWANQAFVDVTTGDTPFYMMTQLGGSKRMRGYYEGRFRDRSGGLLQTELRWMPLERWGFTSFASAGVIGSTPQDWEGLRYAGGAGIRFVADRQKRLNLRLDVAAGPGSTQFHFTVGEAF